MAGFFQNLILFLPFCARVKIISRNESERNKETLTRGQLKKNLGSEAQLLHSCSHKKQVKSVSHRFLSWLRCRKKWVAWKTRPSVPLFREGSPILGCRVIYWDHKLCLSINVFVFTFPIHESSCVLVTCCLTGFLFEDFKLKELFK